MTIQFHPNIRNLIVGRGIRALLAVPDYFGITILSGVQPSVATLESNWSTYYNNNRLLNFTSVVFNQVGANSTATGILALIGSPTSQAAIASGTATWGLMLANNNAMPAAVPTTTGYIIVPVSDQLGNGVIKLSTTTLVSGTGYTIANLTINIT